LVFSKGVGNEKKWEEKEERVKINGMGWLDWMGLLGASSRVARMTICKNGMIDIR
jgi:hypothetical protein